MKDFMDELDIELQDFSGEIPDRSQKEVPKSQASSKPVSANKTASVKVPAKKIISQKTAAKKTHSSKKEDASNTKYGNRVLEFPETKFFLPTLRKGYTRYIPIG